MATARQAEFYLASHTGVPLPTVRQTVRVLRSADRDLWLAPGSGVRKSSVQPHHLVNAVLALANGIPLNGPRFVDSVRALQASDLASLTTTNFAKPPKNALSAPTFTKQYVDVDKDQFKPLGWMLDDALGFLATASEEEIRSSRLDSFHLDLRVWPTLRGELTLSEGPHATICVNYNNADEQRDAASKKSGSLFRRHIDLGFEDLMTFAALLRFSLDDEDGPELPDESSTHAQNDNHEGGLKSSEERLKA